MLALKDLCTKGLLGEIVDIDMWVALETPWGLWEFLADLPRVEILLHSIHYFDAIRHLVEIPSGSTPKPLATRNQNIQYPHRCDFGLRGQVALCAQYHHNHPFGRKYQACEMRICGTKGAAYLHLGVNLNYPGGSGYIRGKPWARMGKHRFGGQLVHRELWLPHGAATTVCQRRKTN